MAEARAFFRRFPALVALTLALALLMRAWVPGGYMPVAANGTVQLLPCSGHGVLAWPGAADHGIGDAMDGMDHAMSGHAMGDHPMAHTAPDGPEHGPSGGDMQLDMPCAFSGLAAPGLTGADPLLLAAALIFLYVAALFARVRVPFRHVAFLSPPAQAPPARV